jgi:hypothetical protein
MNLRNHQPNEPLPQFTQRTTLSIQQQLQLRSLGKLIVQLQSLDKFNSYYRSQCALPLETSVMVP